MEEKMLPVLRGRREEKDEIIDFANFVFSMAHRPHDFASLIPKLYGDETDSSEDHYIIRENGNIQAMLLSMPQTVRMDHIYPGLSFKRYGIGTVSVHHRARSKGHMRRLMHRAINDMAKDGAAYSFLGGQRQRYRYYGYEQAGLVLRFSLGLRNLTMTWPELKGREVPENFTLVDLPSDGPITDQAYQLYLEQTALNAISKEELAVSGRSFYHKYLVMLKDDEKVAALINISSDHASVGEIYLDTNELEPNVFFYDLLKLCGRDQMNFSLKAADGKALLEVEDVLWKAAESTSPGSGGMMLVLDFVKTIAMHLADKATRSRLAPGKLDLKISGCPVPESGEQYVRIHISEDRLQVGDKKEMRYDLALPLVAGNKLVPDDADSTPILEISYLDCLQTLFSYRGLVQGTIVGTLPAAQASWFPLNCHISTAESC